MTVPVADSRAAEVRAAFVQWAALQPSPPSNVEALIGDINVVHDFIGVLSTEIRGRRVTWKSVPAGAREKLTLSSLREESVDPWAVEALSLRERSDHIDTCDACHGAGKALCVACGGGGTRQCTTCRGQRKMYGYAANGSRRLLNCTACRGKGVLDCDHCRKGIASCATCDGSGRLQRWLQIEQWERAVANVHPEGLARQLLWEANPSKETLARDTEIVVDVVRPHRIAPADVPANAVQWLTTLEPPLQYGERVMNQQFRIARLPLYSVQYRLGSTEDRATFSGRRLVAPHSRSSAFATRASHLNALRWLLVCVFLVVTLISLGRGLFFWSAATAASIAAATGALIAIFAAASDWTAFRLHTRPRLIIAGICLALSIAFAALALPRLGHAEKLLGEKRLDAAEAELGALGDQATPKAWADLRLARIRETSDVRVALSILEKIPQDTAQYAEARAVIDAAILASVDADVRRERLDQAAATLALLSASGRTKPAASAAARATLLPIAKREIDAQHWTRGADAIVRARDYALGTQELEPLITLMRDAGAERARAATGESKAPARLSERLRAEEILNAADLAAGDSASPALIRVRSELARDVVAVERARRRP